jgi:hypothetical protein
MRLVVFFLLVQGIEPEALQSTASSPFPSPTPASNSSIPAATVLPCRFREWIRVPGNFLFPLDLTPLSTLFYAILPALTVVFRHICLSPANLR